MDTETEYQAVVKEIESRRRFGGMSGREVTGRFLSALGHPEHGMRVIHIAGTNGKGSTASFLASVLTGLGFHTGLFTSPHLVDFAERILVDGKKISHEDAARLGREILDRKLPGVEDTMFDDCLLMAILYFREQQCDYVVLETGLGGRLDSTSGLDLVPELCIITRIGYDHMKILGNTLREIAGEKAGILVPGTRLVLAENDPEAAERIQEEADHLSVPVTSSAPRIPEAEELLPLVSGDYQKENIANVLAAVDLLFPEKSDKERREALVRGLKRARWPGRMQVLRRDPLLLIDGAHNPQGVHALSESLRKEYGEGPYHFVMGVLADKDYYDMIREILPLASSFRTVTVHNGRSLSADSLAEEIRKQGIPASSSSDARTAIRDAEEEGGPVVCFGSLYFIGEILASFHVQLY